jgi:hypothetical protein
VARRNPFRSEAEAFKLVLLTLAAFAAIAVASAFVGWQAGVAVTVVVIVLGLWYYLRRLPEPVQPRAPRHVGGPEERRVLVVANETVAGRALREAVERAVSGYAAEVLVVAPALNSPIRHWASDEDAARAAAQRRVDESLARLHESGVDARGEVGDSDPLQAIEDALRTFGADEIIISTHPQGRSNWLERGVVTAAQERFALPITHVVVDLEAEAAAGS